MVHKKYSLYIRLYTGAFVILWTMAIIKEEPEKYASTLSYLPSDNSDILKDTSTFLHAYNQALSKLQKQKT